MWWCFRLRSLTKDHVLAKQEAGTLDASEIRDFGFSPSLTSVVFSGPYITILCLTRSSRAQPSLIEFIQGIWTKYYLPHANSSSNEETSMRAAWYLYDRKTGQGKYDRMDGKSQDEYSKSHSHGRILDLWMKVDALYEYRCWVEDVVKAAVVWAIWNGDDSMVHSRSIVERHIRPSQLPSITTSPLPSAV